MTTEKRSATRDSQPSTQWKFWREARVMELEPYYCYWVSHLTSEGLHDKADIATVLAILHQQRDDMQADALRLHREKMDALYGPDGFPRSHVEPLRSHHGKVIEVSQSTDTAPSSTRERTPFEIGKAIADKLAEPLPLVTTLQALQSDADGSYSLRISEAVRQEIVDALYAAKPSSIGHNFGAVVGAKATVSDWGKVPSEPSFAPACSTPSAIAPLNACQCSEIAKGSLSEGNGYCPVHGHRASR